MPSEEETIFFTHIPKTGGQPFIDRFSALIFEIGKSESSGDTGIYSEIGNLFGICPGIIRTGFTK